MSKSYFILRYERTDYAKRICKDYESKRIKERRCNMRKWGIRRDGLSNTLSTVQKDNYLLEMIKLEKEQMNKLRVRKLTPKECFRLMGFDDRDIDVCIENGISNTQLYKMAGNSIVVNVLEGIFRNLLGEGK